MSYSVKRPSHATITYDLKRSGQFHITTRGPNHCGTKPELDVKYTVEVSCLGNELSSRGFMFDQVNVDGYFHSLKVTTLSCERLAERSAQAIARLIRRENAGLIPIKLKVTLSPEPFLAEVSYCYDDPDALKARTART